MHSVNPLEASDLLALPYPARSRIFEYLNFNSLKNLRLVNHLTKSWVEDNSELLGTFNCQIGNESCLRDVINSSVPWNCFNIQNLGSNDLTSFLEVYGNVAKHLVINSEEMNSDYISNHFGDFGQQLESLSVVSTCTIKSESSSPRYDGIRKFFPNLTSLEYSGYGRASVNEAGVFRTLLPMCPNLKTLYVSRLHSPLRGEHLGIAARQDVISDIIYKPILEYLKNQKILQKIELTKLKIDLGQRNTISDSYDLNYQMLLNLVDQCELVGAKLLNVPGRALPNLNDSRKLTKNQLNGLDNVIESVFVTSRKGLNDKVVPSNSEITVDISSRETLPGFSTFTLHGKVKIIRFQSMDRFLFYSDSTSEMFLAMFRYYRPTLQELSVQHNTLAYAGANGLQMSTNFPNLRILKLTLWGETEEDFHHLLKGLPKLENLSLRSCKLCSDIALLGPDIQNPLIRQLPKLVHLRLDESNISDSTFVNALRYMKLRSFEWSSFSVSSNLVTFKNGISSLGTIEGGFRDSIEIFEVEVPLDCKSEDLAKLISNSFRSIKNFQFYEDISSDE